VKITFDVDNVLADSMTCWCRKATKHLGRVVTKDEIKSHKIVGSISMSPPEIFKLQDEVWTEWRDLPTTEEDLPQKLGLLKKSGFHVVIATSRPLRSINWVKKWLAWQKIPYDEFFAFGPYRSKTEIGTDALVDDAPDQIREFVRIGKTGFLYIQPWNRNVKMKKAIPVTNIGDVLRFYRLNE